MCPARSPDVVKVDKDALATLEALGVQQVRLGYLLLVTGMFLKLSGYAVAIQLGSFHHDA